MTTFIYPLVPAIYLSNHTGKTLVSLLQYFFTHKLLFKIFSSQCMHNIKSSTGNIENIN